jgi:hypothetical protein
LFPIKYHEVQLSEKNNMTNTFLDLANVQESRGVFLDCRGNRPFKRSL